MESTEHWTALSPLLQACRLRCTDLRQKLEKSCMELRLKASDLEVAFAELQGVRCEMHDQLSSTQFVQSKNVSVVVAFLMRGPG